jgi:hypothetical protein
MKLKLSNYYKPTPEKIRKISDAIVGACGLVSGSSILADYRNLAAIFLGLMFVSKFISNLFVDDNNVQ